MKTLFKWVKRLLLGVLLVLVLVVLLGGYLLGTDSGFSRIAGIISDRVGGLEIGQVSGNLTNGADTDSLSFRNASMAIEARNLDTNWRLSCLTQREFCLDGIIIDELTVETFATDKPPAEPGTGPIELPAISLPLDVRIGEILIRRLNFKAPGDAPIQVLEDIRLSADAQGSQLNIRELSARYQSYTAALDGDITLEGDYPLQLGLTVDAADLLPDTLPEGTGDQAATVRLQLANSLKDLSIDMAVTGPVVASLTGKARPLEKDIPATLELSSDVLGWPLISHQQVQAHDTVVRIDGTLDDYQVSLSTRVSGEQVPETTLSLAGLANTERVILPEIEVGTLGGTATATAQVSWIDLLQWRTTWNIANIDPSLQLPEVTGRLDAMLRASGRVENGNWTLDVPAATVSGTLREYPFKLDAKVSKGLDNLWNIDKVILDNGSNRVNVNGTVSDAWKLDAKITLPQLQNLLPELAGGFDATLGLRGPLATPDVDLNASSSVIKYNDILVQGVSIEADIDELFVTDSKLSVAVGTVQSGEQIIRNTRVNLAGKRNEHVLTVFADGPDATAIDLTASGALGDTFDWLGSLDKVELEAPAHRITLNQPTELAWDHTQKKFSVDAHCWVTEGSQLCLQNKVLAEASGTADITLNDYALNRLNPFLPAETTLKGSLAMDATINWGDTLPGGFAATVTSRIIDGGAEVVDASDNVVNFTYDELTLNTQLDPTSVSADLNLVSKNLGQADISIQLDPSGEEKPIEGTLSLDGLDVGVAKAFLPDFDEVAGTLNVSGDVSGLLTDPRFDGEIVLDNPRLRAEMLPLAVTGGRIITTVKGKRAVIGGRLDSGDGTVDIDGSANWQQPGAWRADVTLDGEKLNVQSDPVQESRIDHVVKIGARPGIIRINGDINIPMAVIDVEDLPQGAASVSTDVVVIEDIEEETVVEKPATTPGGTKLVVALNVELGDEVTLSAYGLNARLTGDMTVRVTSPNPPQLGGEIEVVDGIYKQYGQNLKANGQILFVGPVNQSRLDIDAIREIDSEDRVAGLNIGGTVASPEITLFTEPGDKSQDAILSYIVLGRDINEASDQEANLLATAALALTVKGGRNIAGGIASAIGVEDFALETRGSGDSTELVVSGRLNDRLLLRYGRSVFEPESTLYLRYDLTKKLYLEAAQGVDSAVDLFYSFSF